MSHHDPDRSDEEIDAIIETHKAKLAEDGARLELTAAAEGETVEIEGASDGAQPKAAVEETATRKLDPATVGKRLAIGALRPDVERVIREAAAAESVSVETLVPGPPPPVPARGGDEAIAVLDREAAPAAFDAYAAAAGKRAARNDGDAAPLLLIAGGDGAEAPASGEVGDLMVWPFTKEFAQSRIRAAVLRERCRWGRAPKPDDEIERLNALRRLNVLDTPTEERFDRITRIARQAFDVPLALVTFIDSDRQWFKSRVGLDFSETTRDAAFCAHTILRGEALIVEDTALDDRFADNPSVNKPPYVRFYAGHPLRMGRGAALGSLCLIDFRPHRFGPEKAEMLADLAEIVMSELVKPAPDAEPVRMSV